MSSRQTSLCARRRSVKSRLVRRFGRALYTMQAERPICCRSRVLLDGPGFFCRCTLSFECAACKQRLLGLCRDDPAGCDQLLRNEGVDVGERFAKYQPCVIYGMSTVPINMSRHLVAALAKDSWTGAKGLYACLHGCRRCMQESWTLSASKTVSRLAFASHFLVEVRSRGLGRTDRAF